LTARNEKDLIHGNQQVVGSCRQQLCHLKHNLRSMRPFDHQTTSRIPDYSGDRGLFKPEYSAALCALNWQSQPARHSLEMQMFGGSRPSRAYCGIQRNRGSAMQTPERSLGPPERVLRDARRERAADE
jgi:hypothetical protein